MSVTASSDATRRGRAAAVLHGHDAGRWTKASPHLYPHQWSWDSAFIAIGWAHLDVGRAMAELENLFAAQWQTGHGAAHRVPGRPGRALFPGPQWWDCPSAPAAPALPIQTTGICQPPVHALAVRRPWEGTDSSPRWDSSLARITLARPRPYTRLDTLQVRDPSQRPADWDYDRYLWLVGLLRTYRYDDAEIYRRYPFLISWPAGWTAAARG